MTITITLNGEAKDLEKTMTVRELVEFLAIKSPAMAVEVNKRIIRKDEFDTVSVADGDRIEIVTFVGGG